MVKLIPGQMKSILKRHLAKEMGLKTVPVVRDCHSRKLVKRGKRSLKLKKRWFFQLAVHYPLLCIIEKLRSLSQLQISLCKYKKKTIIKTKKLHSLEKKLIFLSLAKYSSFLVLPVPSGGQRYGFPSLFAGLRSSNR